MAQRDESRRWVRVLVWTAVVIVVLVLLFTVVFPWVETLREDPTLGLRVTGRGRG